MWSIIRDVIWYGAMAAATFVFLVWPILISLGLLPDREGGHWIWRR